MGFAAFYESLGRVDLMENHPDEQPVFISGKQVREMLLNGETVDPRIMRPGTSPDSERGDGGNVKPRRPPASFIPAPDFGECP